MFVDEKYLKTFDITAGYSRNWTLWSPDFVPPSNFYEYISDQKVLFENWLIENWIEFVFF